MRMIFGIVLLFFSLGFTSTNELCELQVSESMQCITPSDLSGDTFTFKNALTRVAQDGLVFCDGEDEKPMGQTAILYMFDHSGAVSNWDKSNSAFPDVLEVIEHQQSQYPESYIGFMDFAGNQGNTIDIKTAESFDIASIQTNIKYTGRTSASKLLRGSNLVSEFKEAHPDVNVVMYFITDKVGADNIKLVNELRQTINKPDGKNYIELEYRFDSFYMINSVSENSSTSMFQLSGNSKDAELNRIPISKFNLLQVLKDNIEVSMSRSKPVNVLLTNRDTDQSVTTQRVSQNEQGNWNVALSEILPLQEGSNTIDFEISYNNLTTVNKSIIIEVAADKKSTQESEGVFGLSCKPRSMLSFIDEKGDAVTAQSSLDPVDLLLYAHDQTNSSEIIVLGTGSSWDSEFWTVEQQESKGTYQSGQEVTLSLGGVTEDNSSIEMDDPDVIMAFWKHAVDPRDTAYARLVFSSEETFKSGEVNTTLRDSLLDAILGEGTSEEEETTLPVDDSGRVIIPDGLTKEESVPDDTSPEKEPLEENRDDWGKENALSTNGDERIVVESGTTFLDYSKDLRGDPWLMDPESEEMTRVSKQTDEGTYRYNDDSQSFELISAAGIEDGMGQLISVDIAYPEGGAMVWDADMTIQLSYFSTDAQFLKYYSFTDVVGAVKEGEESSHMRYVFEWLPTMDVNGHAYLTLDNGRRVGSGVVIMQVKQVVTFTLHYDYNEKKKGTKKHLENTNTYTFGYVRPDAR
ncbi:MAG: hypothetical protein OCD01_06555 [Fibrobacterales bacterium]